MMRLRRASLLLALSLLIPLRTANAEGEAGLHVQRTAHQGRRTLTRHHGENARLNLPRIAIPENGAPL